MFTRRRYEPAADFMSAMLVFSIHDMTHVFDLSLNREQRASEKNTGKSTLGLDAQGQLSQFDQQLLFRNLSQMDSF